MKDAVVVVRFRAGARLVEISVLAELLAFLKPFLDVQLGDRESWNPVRHGPGVTLGGLEEEVVPLFVKEEGVAGLESIIISDCVNNLLQEGVEVPGVQNRGGYLEGTVELLLFHALLSGHVYFSLWICLQEKSAGLGKPSLGRRLYIDCATLLHNHYMVLAHCQISRKDDRHL